MLKTITRSVILTVVVTIISREVINYMDNHNVGCKAKSTFIKSKKIIKNKIKNMLKDEEEA